LGWEFFPQGIGGRQKGGDFLRKEFVGKGKGFKKGLLFGRPGIWNTRDTFGKARNLEGTFLGFLTFL